MYARMPPDKWAGVRTHALNELWAEDGKGANQFTKWLGNAGRQYVVDSSVSAFSLFKIRKRVNGELDTWVCFAGVNERTNILYRKHDAAKVEEEEELFKIISESEVSELAQNSESDQQRIVRRVQRSLAAKKASFKPSPAHRRTANAEGARVTPGDRAATDYDEADAITVSPDTADDAPWSHLSRQEKWSSSCAAVGRAESAEKAQRDAERACGDAIKRANDAESEVLTARAALAEGNRLKQAALDENVALRARDNTLHTRMSELKRINLSLLERLQSFERHELVINLRLAEGLARQREETIRELRQELLTAKRLHNLGPLDEPPSSDMLKVY